MKILLGTRIYKRSYVVLQTSPNDFSNTFSNSNSSFQSLSLREKSLGPASSLVVFGLARCTTLYATLQDYLKHVVPTRLNVTKLEELELENGKNVESLRTFGESAVRVMISVYQKVKN